MQSFILKQTKNVPSITDQPMELAEDDEEAIRNKEQEILELGQKYSKEGKAEELAQLIRQVRPFLAMISKAKAAKLVRGLVDLFLDMEAATGSEVQLCKVLTTLNYSQQLAYLHGNCSPRNALTGL